MIDRIEYIGCQAGATHPYAPANTVRRCAECACLLQSGFVVSQEPSMPRAVVAMRCECDIDYAIQQ